MPLPSLLSLHLPSPSQTSFSSCPVRRHNASPGCINTLYNGVVNGREIDTGSDRHDDIWPERRRPSDPANGGPATNSQNRPSLSYPSPTVDDTMYKKSIRNCMEGELAAISRTSPATFEPASLKRPKLSPEEADYANQEWEVRKVISKEYVASVLHYLVKWCPTLEPQHSLGHVKELMDEFEAQLRAHRGAKNGREGLRLKIKRQVTAEADASRGQQKRSDEDGHGSQSEIGNRSKEVQHTAVAPIQDIARPHFGPKCCT